MSKDDYIQNSEATHIRVFDEGFSYAIDAADDQGGYTESVWTHFDDKPLDRSTAKMSAPHFAMYIGRSDLIDKVKFFD